MSGDKPPVTIYGPDNVPPAANNRFSRLIPSQSIAVVSEFTLESGVTLNNVSVGFRTWGKLNANKDNVMVICHALTGSSDVEDWWGSLLGSTRSFDPTRYFIFCANVMGSPYGTSSPVTQNQDRQDGKWWGPEFPSTMIRDDVRLHKLLLDHLGVNTVAAVIGGSMGGMAVLEWPLTTPQGYRRQSIYSDPDYESGWYDANNGEGPRRGLAAARMAALLTYRSRDSFESRFGRKEVDSDGEGRAAKPKTGGIGRGKMTDATGLPRTMAERAEAAHNDGHPSTFFPRPANLYPLHHLHQSSAPNLTSDTKATNSLLDSTPIVTFTSLARWIPMTSDTVTMDSSSNSNKSTTTSYEFLHARLPEIYEGEPLVEDKESGAEGFEPAKASLFGEAEGDVTAW
ncbi:hypothetical protein JCM5353_005338 [Sporobolomyces roseus]